MKDIKNLLVSMRDGVRIAVDVYLPATGAPSGAVLYLGPYRKDDYILAGSVSKLPALLTSRGLALVVADARGTNDSEGEAPVMFSEAEQQDCYELVEWIAAQPWCNGNVGMTGVSYGFWTSVMAAALQPPHLRTIVPIHGSVSWFYCVHEGGMPMAFGYHANYLALMLSLQGSPPGFRDSRWADLWNERLQSLQPWGLDWLEHMADDAWYSASSLAPDYQRVKVPVFAIGGWWDRYPGDPLRLAEELSAPVKVLVGPWQHMRPDAGVPGPRVDYDVITRWFEHWLNSVDNGIMEEPRMTYYMQRFAEPCAYRSSMPGEWQHAARWPIPQSPVQRSYLSDGDSLSLQAPTSNSRWSYEYDPRAGFCGGLAGGIYGGVGMPLDQRPEADYSVLYQSAPLERELDVLGVARVKLAFSSTARRMGVVARLCDVAPDGSIALVTRGYLNLAHRDGLDKPSPPTPGTAYDIEILLKATGYRFAPGHRIGLMVTSAEFPSLLPTPDPGTNTIHGRGGRFASCLELPIVERSSEVDAPPPMAGSPVSTDPPKDKSFRVTLREDGTAEAVLEVRGTTQGLGCTIAHTQVTSSTVDSRNPANVRLYSESVYRFEYDSGATVESAGRMECSGSPETLRLEATLTVIQNSAEKMTRRWRKNYAREFI